LSGKPRIFRLWAVVTVALRVKKLVRMVDPVDLRRAGAVAPGESTTLDRGSSPALRDQAVV